MLNPIRIRQAVHIRATPEEVWSLYENPPDALGLLPKGARFELLTERMDEPGSTWRIVTTAGKKQMSVLNEVVDAEKPVRQVLRSTSDRMTGTSHSLLTRTPDGTLMTIDASAVYPATLRTLPDRLLTAFLAPIATRRAMKKMKRLVEDRQRSPSSGRTR